MVITFMETVSNSRSGQIAASGFSKWIGLVVLCMAQIGSSGDNTVVSIATSALVKTLGASMSQIQLTNLMFPLVTGALMMVGGMLGLLIGWRKLFRCGVLLMLVGEILSATSPNITLLNWVARFIVGLGASAMVPALLGLVAGTYQGKDRAVAFGAIGAATGIACFIAPVVAGWLVDSFSWRVAFWVLAIYFAVVLSGSLLIKEVPKAKQPIRFDSRGTLLTVIGLFLLIISVSKIPVWGLVSPLHVPVIAGNKITFFGISPALPLAIVGIIILWFMVKVEGRVENKTGSALVPSSFLKTPQVRDGLFMTVLIFLSFGGLLFLVIPYLELVAGLSPVMSGVALVAMGLPLTVFSIGLPKLFSEISARKVCRWGIVLNVIGCLIMAFSLHPEGVSPWLYPGLVLFGAGSGMLSSQASTVIANAVDARDAQQSGGIQATSRNIGQAVGIAVLGVVMLFGLTGPLQTRVKSDSLLSGQAKSWVNSQKSISFLSDAAFKAEASTHLQNPDDVHELVYLNAQVRANATRRSMLVLALITLLFLFGTSALPTRHRKAHPNKLHHHWWN